MVFKHMTAHNASRTTGYRLQATGYELLATYTWGSGIDNLLAVTIYEESATNTYYAIKDHLNSVHALVDTTGAVAWSCTYSAWGTPQNSQLSIINSQFQLCYLFQGREYSTVTGLYNFRARWYDSGIGRWLSKDSIGLEGGLNLYVFCGNDPVNFVDPWGEWGFDSKSSYNYWGKVAVSGFDKGGASGYAQAAGASLMQAFIDFWGARSIQNNAEKSGHYSAQEGCENKALKHGALATGEIAMRALTSGGAMRAARLSRVAKAKQIADTISKSKHSIDVKKGIRMDLKGRHPLSKGHFNKATGTQHGYPHVHDPSVPSGVRVPVESDWQSIYSVFH